MNTNKLHVFGSMTAMFLVATVAFAQDATDDIGPAVDTSAVVQEDADDSPTSVEPGVDTSASDIRPAPSSQRSRVMDSMQLDRTEITGNQELPKVLYIVPWKKSNPGDLMGRPVNTLLDEVLAPIDREEFLRQVDYYNDLHGNEQE